MGLPKGYHIQWFLRAPQFVVGGKQYGGVFAKSFSKQGIPVSGYAPIPIRGGLPAGPGRPIIAIGPIGADVAYTKDGVETPPASLVKRNNKTYASLGKIERISRVYSDGKSALEGAQDSILTGLALAVGAGIALPAAASALGVGGSAASAASVPTLGAGASLPSAISSAASSVASTVSGAVGSIGSTLGSLGTTVGIGGAAVPSIGDLFTGVLDKAKQAAIDYGQAEADRYLNKVLQTGKTQGTVMVSEVQPVQSTTPLVTGEDAPGGMSQTTMIVLGLAIVAVLIVALKK